MKVLLISGHGAGDPGALGQGYKESDLTRELVNLIKPHLEKYTDVTVYDQNRNAFKDVSTGDFKFNKFDYAFEVHFNAFTDEKAHGTECYVTTMEKGITVEQNIMRRMGRYFTLRDNDGIFDGVKRTNFLVIKTLKNHGISGALLETCFITNHTDMLIYQANKNAIAEDIAGGIIDGFKLNKVVSNYYQAFNNKSIVDGLKSIGVNSSYDNRKAIAKANGIVNYFGTVEQNLKLCELAREGKLKKIG